MSLTKRGKKWWFEFVHNGVRIRESTGQCSKDQARKAEAKRRAQLHKEDEDRDEWAAKLRCAPEALRHCSECARLFDGTNPIESKDGKHIFCCEVCETKWRSRENPTPTFTVFVDRFRKEMRSRHAGKPKTVSYYDNSLDRLLEHEPFRDARLDHIDEEMIAAYVVKRKKAKKRNGKTIKIATVNRELEVLRRMLRLAAEWKEIQRVPTIHRQPGEEGREVVVSHADEAAYLAVAAQPLRDVATSVVDCAFRPEEVHRCRWENVHFKPADKALYGYVRIPDGKTKFAKRNVPMTLRVKALLEMRWEAAGRPAEGWVYPAETKSGHINTDSLKKQHARSLKESKVQKFVIYSLRHTALTRLGEAGADAFAIQKIAGHSSILISQKYVHPTPEKVETAFTQLEDYNARKVEEFQKEQQLEAARSVQ